MKALTFTLLVITLWCVVTATAHANLINVTFDTPDFYQSQTLTWSLTNTTPDGRLLVGGDVLTVTSNSGSFIWKGADFYSNRGDDIKVVGYNDGEVVFEANVDILCSGFDQYSANVAVDELVIYGAGSTYIDNFLYELASNCTSSFGGLFTTCCSGGSGGGGGEPPGPPPPCPPPPCNPPCNPPPPEPPPNPVPEPSTFVLFGAGMLLAGRLLGKVNNKPNK